MRFGSFEILAGPDGKQHLLGKGAFGRTYKARHIFLERTVALKIINDRFMADPKARERFLGEARAAAKLQHPHIAQILDFGETDGMLFYAMEYCSGGDLSDYVKRNGPLSVVQTVQIGLQVAAALQCAHGAGFIHRDLKPSNLMLASPDGPLVTKLIDFGLVMAAADEDAEPIDPDEIPTIEQRFVGTPLFASPEQLLVQPLDIRSDFFALGMTLWYLILGSPPDPGNSSAVVAARLKADSYAPRLPQKLPQAFQAVLARLLEKQPENRFANATQLLSALGKCAAGLGLPTAATSIYKSGTDDDSEVEEAGPPQPAVIERIAVPVEECYALQGERGSSPTGADFAAKSLTDQSTVWLHFLKPSLLANAKTLERLRKNIGHLQRRPAAALLAVSGLREHPDRTLVVMEAPSGSDLLSLTKTAGAMRLADARPLLQTIANVCDTLVAAGLPAPDLYPQRIFVRPGNAGALLMPRFLSLQDVSAVEPIPPVPTEPGWQFAALIHRVLAARALPPAPEVPKVEGLTDEGNRLLTHALGGQLVHATCSELLADLLIAEGLMGASLTRTHSTSTSLTSPSTTHIPEPAPAIPPPLPTAQDSQATSTPPLPAVPPTAPRAKSRPAPVRTAPRSPSAWPLLLGIVFLICAIGGAGTWLVYKMSAGKGGSFFTRSSVVQLQGDLPPHATAKVGTREVELKHEGDRWQASFDGTDLPFPAQLVVEAKGFQPVEIPLNSPADLAQPHDASLKRATGTLVFERPNGSDYDRAVLRMTAQLPDEQAFVELERYPRGIPFGSELEAIVPTGIFQLTLRGADERTVRPLLFDRVEIKPGARTTFELPPSFAGNFGGLLTGQRAGVPESDATRIEVIIDPSLTTGTYVESGKRGARRLMMVEGKLDSEGKYSARIQFSLATEGDRSFDQVLTLRRGENGAYECETFEAPEEDPIIERRLKRPQFSKEANSAKGTLRREK